VTALAGARAVVGCRSLAEQAQRPAERVHDRQRSSAVAGGLIEVTYQCKRSGPDGSAVYCGSAENPMLASISQSAR